MKPEPVRRMVSAIIPTHDSEIQVVRTLACLVGGVTAGFLREVILADAGSRDETEKVADIAGGRFLALPGPPGARLLAAAQAARGPWLLFLQPGAVLEPGWAAEVEHFLMQAGAGRAQAAAFRPQWDVGLSPLVRGGRMLRAAFSAPTPASGLLVPKRVYVDFAGSAGEMQDPLARLMRKLGRRRIAILRAAISV